MRLLRSYLFAPGNQGELLVKVFRAGADAVVLDLEDAVPETEKGVARDRVREAVLGGERSEAPGASPAIFVRINGLRSPHWRRDVESVVLPGVSGLRVPKAESLEDFCRLNDLLTACEAAAGLPVGSVSVVATVESARGIANLAELSRGPRISGFTFGAADFCADIGADPASQTGSLVARSSLVATSRLRRLVPPIASVFTRLHDDEGLRADSEAQKELGFFGRSAIHPRQLPVIHDVFSPTVAEVAAARAILDVYESALLKGQGASRSDDEFVDLAVVRRARATVELAASLRKE